MHYKRSRRRGLSQSRSQTFCPERIGIIILCRPATEAWEYSSFSPTHLRDGALEALDLIPNSNASFLNIGSGTGYISCIASEILGNNSLNYGVELHEDVIDHFKTSVSNWKTNTIKEGSGSYTIHFTDGAEITIIEGNGLKISKEKGESAIGFDRIYLGSTVSTEVFRELSQVLSPGGILVGPLKCRDCASEHLVKVERASYTFAVIVDHEGGTEDDDDSSPIGLSAEFSSRVLCGVRFTPLESSANDSNTVIPAKVWSPSIEKGFPCEFKRAVVQLLMCSNSQVIQPLPKEPSDEERFNAAGMLPRVVWLKILSYTHRKWFKPDKDEITDLQLRLIESEKARKEAEARFLVSVESRLAAERERAVYRALAHRWQRRCALLGRQGDAHEEDAQEDRAADEVSDLLDLAAGHDHGPVVFRFENRSALSRLIASLQEHDRNDVDNDDSDDDSSDDEMPDLESIPGNNEDDNDAADREDADSEDEMTNSLNSLIDFKSTYQDDEQLHYDVHYPRD